MLDSIERSLQRIVSGGERTKNVDMPSGDWDLWQNKRGMKIDHGLSLSNMSNQPTSGEEAMQVLIQYASQQTDPTIRLYHGSDKPAFDIRSILQHGFLEAYTKEDGSSGFRSGWYDWLSDDFEGIGTLYAQKGSQKGNPPVIFEVRLPQDQANLLYFRERNNLDSLRALNLPNREIFIFGATGDVPPSMITSVYIIQDGKVVNLGNADDALVYFQSVDESK